LILSRLSARGRLVAMDRDPQAAEAAAAIADPRFHFVHTRFSRLSATLASMGVTRLHGLLLDLGFPRRRSMRRSAASPGAPTLPWTCGWTPLAGSLRRDGCLATLKN